MKDRVRHERIHATLETRDHSLATRRGQGDSARPTDEIVGRYLAVVDQRQDDRIGDQRAELFGQVQGQRRPTVSRLVEKPEHRIEARRVQGHSQLFDQQRIDKGQHRIDPVPRRAAVAVLEAERLVLLEQRRPSGEIQFGGHAFHAQQRRRFGGRIRLADVLGQRR